MLSRYLAFLLISWLTVREIESRSFTVDYDQNSFLKDGEKFRYVAGSIHYFRSPEERWESILQKARLGGLNTITTYVSKVFPYKILQTMWNRQWLRGFWTNPYIFFTWYISLFWFITYSYFVRDTKKYSIFSTTSLNSGLVQIFAKLLFIKPITSCYFCSINTLFADMSRGRGMLHVINMSLCWAKIINNYAHE